MPIILAIRIELVDPPEGYAFCLQRGKGSRSAGRVKPVPYGPPRRVSRLDVLSFDGVATLA